MTVHSADLVQRAVKIVFRAIQDSTYLLHVLQLLREYVRSVQLEHTVILRTQGRAQPVLEKHGVMLVLQLVLTVQVLVM